MKRRSLRVDWDDLEAAFNNRDDQIAYHLDLVTGHVHIEGEGESYDDEEDAQYQSSNDGTRAYVTPPTTDVLVGWMRKFIAEGQAEGETAERLLAELEKKDVAGVRGVLNDDAEVRDLWYAYRADRTHEMIHEFLETHAVDPTEPPPWD